MKRTTKFWVSSSLALAMIVAGLGAAANQRANADQTGNDSKNDVEVMQGSTKSGTVVTKNGQRVSVIADQDDLNNVFKQIGQPSSIQSSITDYADLQAACDGAVKGFNDYANKVNQYIDSQNLSQSAKKSLHDQVANIQNVTDNKLEHANSKSEINDILANGIYGDDVVAASDGTVNNNGTVTTVKKDTGTTNTTSESNAGNKGDQPNSNSQNNNQSGQGNQSGNKSNNSQGQGDNGGSGGGSGTGTSNNGGGSGSSQSGSSTGTSGAGTTSQGSGSGGSQGTNQGSNGGSGSANNPGTSQPATNNAANPSSSSSSSQKNTQQFNSVKDMEDYASQHGDDSVVGATVKTNINHIVYDADISTGNNGGTFFVGDQDTGFESGDSYSGLSNGQQVTAKIQEYDSTHGIQNTGKTVFFNDLQGAGVQKGKGKGQGGQGGSNGGASTLPQTAAAVSQNNVTASVGLVGVLSSAILGLSLVKPIKVRNKK